MDWDRTIGSNKQMIALAKGVLARLAPWSRVGYNIIFAIPKSSSTNVYRIFRKIQLDATGTAWPKPKPYMARPPHREVVNHDMFPGIEKYLKGSGLVSLHSYPRNYTLYLLDQNPHLKYSVLIRHPLDQLSAFYCHMLKPGNRNLGKYDYIAPLEPLDGLDIDAGIQALLDSGYLENVFDWIGGWLKFRDTKRSIVLVYEEYIKNPVDFYQQMSEHYLDRSLSEKQIDYVREEFGRVGHGVDARDLNTEFYPRGYSGCSGIWKNYLSEENKEIIRTRYYERLALLADYYPDLREL